MGASRKGLSTYATEKPDSTKSKLVECDVHNRRAAPRAAPGTCACTTSSTPKSVSTTNVVPLRRGCYGVFARSWLQGFIPTYQGIVDQWTYGTGRVYHTTARLYGSQTSDIFAFSRGDITDVIIITNNKTQAYSLALQTDVPIVSLEDMNNDGKIDLVIHDEQSIVATTLYNTGSAFQATPPNK